jgi:hypothetical protein
VLRWLSKGRTAANGAVSAAGPRTRRIATRVAEASRGPSFASVITAASVAAGSAAGKTAPAPTARPTVTGVLHLDRGDGVRPRLFRLSVACAARLAHVVTAARLAAERRCRQLRAFLAEVAELGVWTGGAVARQRKQACAPNDRFASTAAPATTTDTTAGCLAKLASLDHDVPQGQHLGVNEG